MADPVGHRLLLVEDDDNIALLMRKALERAGHQVSHGRTAAEALALLKQQPFELALLDHHLPDTAGLDLLEQMVREGVPTPALVITAFGDEQLATKVLHAGALDYVVKDPGLNFLAELPKRVAEAVERHRLQQLNRLLSAALESARDGILITDLDGSILHVNQALEQLTGYGRHELIGQKPWLLKSESDSPEGYAGLWRAILNKTSWQGELTHRRKDGSLVEVSLTVSPIFDGRGQLTQFVCIQRDISDRRRLERQLVQAQKMQSIGTLAGGVAHEFNNLLTGIAGYAALGLREPELHEPLREYLQHVVDLSERAAGLTRQLLAFARSRPMSRRTTPLEELVRATATLVEQTLRTRATLNLQGAAADGTPLSVEADAHQLQQALINLALNAHDAQLDSEPAASQAAPVIVFRLRPVVLESARPAFPDTVPAGDYAVIDVEDTGRGMTPEVLNQALDPFFTTKDVGRGTGLGLPVVFGIVHAHQGYLAIDTSPGRGTCVSLYLPRAK